jgi:lysophospholipase L1-like esterase
MKARFIPEGVVALLLGALCVTEAVATSAAPLSNRGSLPTEKDLARHDEFMSRKDHLIKTGGTQLVFVGDSITDFWRTDPQRELFEDYFGQYRPYNIAVAGDETQHVLWRVEHGELDGIAPKVVVIMIGTNNIGHGMSAEETSQGIATLVTTIRHKLPGSKILLLGIFPRGNRSDDPVRVAVNRTNTMIAGLDDGRYVRYLDIGDKFLDSGGSLSGVIMPDYVHPNARGYEIWATAIKSTVDAMER